MSPEDFIKKWRYVELSERAASQDHFNELCELLEVKKPTDADMHGDWFTFEKSVKGGGKSGGGGFADVWRKDCFVWEYKRRKKPKEAAEEKGKGKEEYKTIAAALAQAREYAALLENPPLVIACDIDQIAIRTLFTGSVSVTHTIKLIDLYDSTARGLLKRCFTDPASLRPHITPQTVTEEAATKLATLASTLRDRKDSIGQPHDPRRVAHFLNKIVFCLFAEDSSLLPGGVFSAIIEEAQRDHTGLSDMLADLFDGMRYGKRRFGTITIPWFNGGLFDDDDVLDLQFSEVRILGEAAKLDWASIDPTIFGTLFERGLDPAKRKEMANLFDTAATKMSRAGTAKRSKADAPGSLPLRGGANPARRSLGKGVGIHYTDSATIMKIVEPVVLRPLIREWDQEKRTIAALKTKAARDQRYLKFRERLGTFRVLDPACGSGNFLYLALRHLKDFDQKVEQEARHLGLTADPKGQRVTPRNMLGIEVNPYAAELARVTVWIGELQWQLRNGYKVDRRPILGTLDGIENRDALLAPNSTEIRWPKANVIVGNPPFLGTKKMMGALGTVYVDALRAEYDGRVSAFSDLVCYWFEKGRDLVSRRQLDAVGLVATNSIRGGRNRLALDAVVKDCRIYSAWSDEAWSVDGANVRVSLVAFDSGKYGGNTVRLNGNQVQSIRSDLTDGTISTALDVSKVAVLPENKDCAYVGIQKTGPFDIPGDKARQWLKAPENPHRKPNSDVLKPYWNGIDLTRRPRDYWLLDFPLDRTESDVSAYEAPFEYARQYIKPTRVGKREARANERWWEHYWPRPEMRAKLTKLERYIVTPEVAKHRLFVWQRLPILPDKNLTVIVRDDDTSLGILHSIGHALWSSRLGTSLEDRPRYTPSSTFDTFPFPAGLTPDIPARVYEGDRRARRIATCARKLNELREAWLNPSDLVKKVSEVVPGYPDRLLPVNSNAEATLKERTLTKLYNDRPTWLTLAHRDLDRAVAASYGWPEELADRAQPENPDAADRRAAEEEILRLLFELNQERATKQQSTS